MYDDATWDCDDSSNEAVELFREPPSPREDRGLYFSWSPDSRYVVIPSVRRNGTPTTVYYLESAKRRPKVRLN